MPPDLPDLIVRYSPSASRPGELIHSAEICNKGIGRAGRSQLDFYRNRATAPVPGERGDLIADVPELAAGACTSVTLRDSDLAAGSYQTYAQVDAAQVVSETIDNNNVDGPYVVQVQPSLGQPDLRVELNVDVAGTAVTLTPTACNDGPVTSPATSVDLYLDRTTAPSTNDSGDKQLSVAVIAAHGCISLPPSTYTIGAGTHLAWASIDRAMTVAESNEANNLAGPITYNVAAPALADLHITSFTATPVQLTSLIRYQLHVCNEGNKDSVSTDVTLYRTQSEPPSVGVLGDLTTTVRALAPQDCDQLQFVTDLPRGSYTSWAVVDPLGRVSESNEANNVAGPLSVIIDPTRDCVTICSVLAVDCGFIASNQQGDCVTLCQSVSQGAISCALAAAQRQRCIATALCLLAR